MNCEQVRNQDLVEKYVTGQLHELEMSSFEEHYFSCDACLRAVQLGQAIVFGGGKAKGSAQVTEMPRRGAGSSRWIVPLAAAAAVVLVTVIGWRSFVGQAVTAPEVAKLQSVPSSKPVAEVPRPAATAPEARLLASNSDLEAVEPLIYRSSVLRGGDEEASQRFRRVMASYLEHDYRKATVGLAAIPVAVPAGDRPDEHITDAGVQLYLGISQLMLNQNSDAIGSLRRAAAYGDTPYIENADFYLAKAFIRQKQYREAADQLQRVVRLNGDRQADAKKLLEQLRAR